MRPRPFQSVAWICSYHYRLQRDFIPAIAVFSNQGTMDAQAVIDGVQPLSGQVLPVKTVQETQAPEEFGMRCL